MTHANQSPAQTNKTALRAGSSNVPVIGQGKPKDKAGSGLVGQKKK